MTIGYYLGFYSSLRDAYWANGDLFKIFFKFNIYWVFWLISKWDRYLNAEHFLQHGTESNRNLSNHIVEQCKIIHLYIISISCVSDYKKERADPTEKQLLLSAPFWILIKVLQICSSGTCFWNVCHLLNFHL
jgi:hypothetical protein